MEGLTTWDDLEDSTPDTLPEHSFEAASSANDEAESEEEEESERSLSAETGREWLNRRDKARVIRALLRRLSPDEAAPPDLAALLRQLAISQGGLLRDSYRRRLWASLAASHPGGPRRDDSDSSSSVSSDGYFSTDSSPPAPNDASEEEEPALLTEDLKAHRDWRQVEMDVHRTLARFPPNISEQRRSQLQERLTPLIVRLLRTNGDYSYYQGFHDILLTLLLVTEDENAALKIGTQLCSIGLFPFLSEPIENIDDTLQLIFVILDQADPDLERYMRKAEVGSTFALSWLITWFAHTIDDYHWVVRLYDLFLASHPLMPIYLSAAVVLMRSRELQEDCACDMAELHSALLKSFSPHLPLEALIADAQELFLAYPPSCVSNELRGAYKARVALEAEAAVEGRALRRSVSWHFGTAILPRPPQHPFRGRRVGAGRVEETEGGGVVALTFWAVSATAAAWYLYTNSSTWHHLIH